MTDLLEMAVAAHGGLERWSTINTIDVDLSITGAVWYVKGRPNVLKNITMQVHTDAERVSTTFADKDMRTTFATPCVRVRGRLPDREGPGARGNRHEQRNVVAATSLGALIPPGPSRYGT